MTTAIGPLLIEALPRLRRYALSLSRVADVADELVQGACERALASAAIADEMRFDAWMFRIVRNLWYDRLRRLRTRGEELDVTVRDDLVAVEGEAVPERRMLLRRAAKAIDRLPEEQREVLLIVCVEGLSYRDAAEVLDVGTTQLRSLRIEAAEGRDLCMHRVEIVSVHERNS
jgi:RNA polymerase sigma-70 factor (ECF subfamily)